MKGPKEMKRYIAKHKDHLKACHWDDLAIFKWERCKNWFDRNSEKKALRKELKNLPQELKD